MYRIFVTLKIGDDYVSEIRDVRAEIGDYLVTEYNGKHALGAVVSMYEFDLSGEIRPL